MLVVNSRNEWYTVQHGTACTWLHDIAPSGSRSVLAPPKLDPATTSARPPPPSRFISNLKPKLFSFPSCLDVSGPEAMATASMTPAELRSSLAQNGFVRLTSVLSDDQLDTLRAASRRSANLARD